MSSSILIGSVAIPLDSYVIGGTALLGTKGAGKTYAAKGIAEQLLDHSIPIVVFDPIGRWRFMKLAGDDAKRSRGYKIVVAGGEQPDLPLTPASAPQIVRAAIRENIPLVLDLYDRNLSKTDWRRIVQSCFRTLLYENKGLRHVFLEETAEFAPQKVLDGATYAEVEKLVRMGGNASVGITLINQRAQEVNKAVLDLCDNLVLMRQRGAHAIEALEKWVDRLDPAQAKEITRAMPAMGAGAAWVFTGSAESAVRVITDPIHSFHPDRSKPQLSAAAQAERAADPADFIAKMCGELEQLIAEAETNDPVMLRKRIVDLEGQLRTAGADDRKSYGARNEGFQEGKAAGFAEGMLAGEKQFRMLRDSMAGALRDLKRQVFEAVDGVGLPLLPEWQPSEVPAPGRIMSDAGSVAMAHALERAGPIVPRLKSSNGASETVEQKILDALAELRQLGAEHPDRELVAFMSGYTNITSKGFANGITALAGAGLIRYPSPGVIELTDEGLQRASARAHLTSSRELQQRVCRMLGGASERVLQPLIDAYPKAIAREKLAALAGYGNVTSKGFAGSIARLLTLGFISYPERGSIAAQPVLFLEGG